MNQTATSQSRSHKSLTNRKLGQPVLKSWCPPCVMLEKHDSYSVVLNLLGIDQKDILIDVNERKHELAIYAGKKTEKSNKAYFWVFGVPHTGMLSQLKTHYQAGGLEVVIPKRFLAAAA